MVVSKAETRRRYRAIALLVKNHGNDIMRSNGTFNTIKIAKLLETEFDPPVYIGVPRLGDIMREGLYMKAMYQPHPVSGEGDAILQDFKDAIETVKDIAETSLDNKTRISALNTLRALSKDLLEVTHRINEAEIRKAEVSRPIIHVSFGKPVKTDKVLKITKDCEEQKSFEECGTSIVEE